MRTFDEEILEGFRKGWSSQFLAGRLNVCSETIRRRGKELGVNFTLKRWVEIKMKNKKKFVLPLLEYSEGFEQIDIIYPPPIIVEKDYPLEYAETVSNNLGFEKPVNRMHVVICSHSIK